MRKRKSYQKRVLTRMINYSFVVPEPHVFRAGKPPVLTTTNNDESEVLIQLTPCRFCGLLSGGDYHIDSE